MNVIKTPIEGLFIIEPRVFTDDRGYFYETFNEKAFKEATGIEMTFVQDNEAKSSKNVLRGLHYQNAPHAQTKLLRVIDGAIWDVVVDLRKDSATYGKWYGCELTSENKKQFFIPRGFAHGYAVLSDTAVVAYKCDDFYSKEDEGGLFYADPDVNIDWKIDLDKAIVSDKDKVQPSFKEDSSRF